jgi:hypothetical protein
MEHFARHIEHPCFAFDPSSPWLGQLFELLFAALRFDCALDDFMNRGCGVGPRRRRRRHNTNGYEKRQHLRARQKALKNKEESIVTTEV